VAVVEEAGSGTFYAVTEDLLVRYTPPEDVSGTDSLAPVSERSATE